VSRAKSMVGRPKREYICRSCCKEGYFGTPKRSDAKFRCPGSALNQSCGAENLSFDDFFLGSCCETALRWTDSVNDHYEKIKRIQFLYEDSNREINDHKKSLKTNTHRLDVYERHIEISRNKVEAVKKQLMLAQDEVKRNEACLEKAKNEITKCEEKIAAGEETSRKRKARMMVFCAAMVDAEKVPKIDTDADKNTCNVCLENYSSPDRQECALPCGHRFCYKCLLELPQKTCPTCRQDFTVDQIYKLF
jgi:hypothetical protein